MTTARDSLLKSRAEWAGRTPPYPYQQPQHTSGTTPNPAPVDLPEGFAMRFDDFDLRIAETADLLAPLAEEAMRDREAGRTWSLDSCAGLNGEGESDRAGEPAQDSRADQEQSR